MRKQLDPNNPQGSELADEIMLQAVEIFLADFPWLTQHMTKAEMAKTPSLAQIADSIRRRQ
jgi:hypothetical protein